MSHVKDQKLRLAVPKTGKDGQIIPGQKKIG